MELLKVQDTCVLGLLDPSAIFVFTGLMFFAENFGTDRFLDAWLFSKFLPRFTWLFERKKQPAKRRFNFGSVKNDPDKYATVTAEQDGG